MVVQDGGARYCQQVVVQSKVQAEMRKEIRKEQKRVNKEMNKILRGFTEKEKVELELAQRDMMRQR